MRTPIRFRTLFAAMVAGLALILAGCDNSQPAVATAPQHGDVTVTPGPDGVQSVVIDANDEFRFIPDTVRVHVGKVRITLKNVGTTPHDLTFTTLTDGAGKVAVPLTRGGTERSVEFTVNTPGSYRFVCTLHEALNQTGTLIVSP